MKLLVTGTSGFIGTSLCEAFGDREDFDIVGVDRRSPRERFARVRYVTGDLTDASFVGQLVIDANPDTIVHLAAQARVDPSLIAASPTYSDNVQTTLNLISAMEALGQRTNRFVYASSETVYGTTTEYPSRETSPLNPQSPYAASKAASELLVSRAFPQKSLILRSGMGYGPRSDPGAQVVARFITRALHDKPILFPRDSPPEGEPTRDVNFVGNFLEGLDLALRAGVSGVYNIASGREVSISELARAVVRKVGKGSIVCSETFRYRQGEAGARTWLDVSKARDRFGYRPRVALEQGLETTVRWYRSHLDYFEPQGAKVTVPVA